MIPDQSKNEQKCFDFALLFSKNETLLFSTSSDKEIIFLTVSSKKKNTRVLDSTSDVQNVEKI